MRFKMFIVKKSGRAANNQLAANVDGNNRERHSQDKNPLARRQAVAAENRAAKISHGDLHDDNQAHDLQKAAVAAYVVEKIYPVRAGVKGVEHRKEDKEREVARQDVDAVAAKSNVDAFGIYIAEMLARKVGKQED